MKLSPPKTVTYLGFCAIGVLGFLAQFGVLTFLPISGFWLLAIAFILLALSLVIKGNSKFYPPADVKTPGRKTGSFFSLDRLFIYTAEGTVPPSPMSRFR